MSKELVDEVEDVEEMEGIGTRESEEENHKAPEKKKGKALEKKRRRSLTKPGTSQQKWRLASPAESEEKMKVEEDVEWQTGTFPI
jgi:hypothetical protein